MAGVGKGHDSDEALRREVARLVPVAATLGGLILGVVCVLSDLLGVVGGAQGMLIASSIMYSVYESWSKEQTRTAVSRWSYSST
jgi:protein transport protein SEC61 subunit alpha